MKAILAADKNWAIGAEGKLLAHIPGDLRYFKEKTLGKVLVMGRKTLESLPGGRPLPGRRTIVLTRNGEYEKEGCEICRDPKDVLRMEGEGEDIVVAGGGEIYDIFLPYCSEVLVTRMERAFPADTYFKDLDRDEEFVCSWRSELMEENGVGYRFTKYERK